jgi:hypothetical protein
MMRTLATVRGEFEFWVERPWSNATTISWRLLTVDNRRSSMLKLHSCAKFDEEKANHTIRLEGAHRGYNKNDTSRQRKHKRSRKTHPMRMMVYVYLPLAPWIRNENSGKKDCHRSSITAHICNWNWNYLLANYE